jgi:capsid protein
MAAVEALRRSTEGDVLTVSLTSRVDAKLAAAVREGRLPAAAITERCPPEMAARILALAGVSMPELEEGDRD